MIQVRHGAGNVPFRPEEQRFAISSGDDQEREPLKRRLERAGLRLNR